MASDTESGFEKAVRSTSSDQGRRAARPVRAFSEMLVMNERKAGVATGASPELPAAAVGWVFMIGRFSCCDWEAIIKLIESMKKGLQLNFLERSKRERNVCMGLYICIVVILKERKMREIRLPNTKNKNKN